MAAFEIVLRDGAREEVRLSDQPLAIGDVISLGGRDWLVTDEEPARDRFCDRRFVIVPSVATGAGNHVLPRAAMTELGGSGQQVKRRQPPASADGTARRRAPVERS